MRAVTPITAAAMLTTVVVTVTMVTDIIIMVAAKPAHRRLVRRPLRLPAPAARFPLRPRLTKARRLRPKVAQKPLTKHPPLLKKRVSAAFRSAANR